MRLRTIGAVVAVVVVAVVAVAVAGASGMSRAGTITTIAGSGYSINGGFSGDGGPAVRALLANPYYVAVDGKGSVYISDYLNERVRKVNAKGTISTFAGPGTGDQLTNLRHLNPRGVAVDGSGNVYIVDEFDTVLKATPGGTFTRIAGSLHNCGNITCLGDGGPATSAELLDPTAVAVDGQGNVYIADTGNERVRKVTPAGTITTIAGAGRFQHPGYSGDGGPATSALLNTPNGVAVDKKGNLYITDQRNNRVRKVNPKGTITTFAGTGKGGFSGDGGPATRAKLSWPSGIAVDGQGNVYISDNNRIRKVSPRGRITTIAGSSKYGYSGDGGRATRAVFNGTRGVAVDARGNVYIADLGNNRVRKVWK
jgi:trimeric autotransporter adhesin